ATAASVGASPRVQNSMASTRATAPSRNWPSVSSPSDRMTLLRVPAIIQTVARSRPRGWIVVPHDLRGDAGRLTYLAGGQVMADASQHYGLSINILRGLHLSVGILGENLVWDPAIGTETANLSEVQVVQLLEESCLHVFCELREQVRHPGSWITH